MNGNLLKLLLASWLSVSVAACNGHNTKDQQADRPQPYKTQTTVAGDRVPAYKIVAVDEVTTSKQQVTVNVVLQADSLTPNRDNIQNILYGLYAAYSDSPLATSSKKPTHVFIYVYPTVGHYQSGYGQWIGMVSRAGNGAYPEYRVDDERLAALSLPKDDTKFGLKEDERQRIFEEIVRAEKLADSQGTPFKEARKEVAQRHNLTYEEIEDIISESFEKNWPLP